MKVIAIRHGQTDWNAEGRVQGRSDNPLNEAGREQVRVVAGSLPERIDVILSSPLKRARETAEIINARFGVEIIIDNRLIERDFGDYEGQFMKDLDMDSLRRWTDNALTPNGETIKDVTTRIFEFLDFIKTEYQGKEILIVAHGHVLRPINWYFNGLPNEGEEAVIETATSGFYTFCTD